MAVRKVWTSVKASHTMPGAPIQSEDAEGESLPGNLNCLDEALADRTCPGDSSQTYAGHDHALEGGGPIIRGMVWATVGNKYPIATFTPGANTSPGWLSLGFGYASSSPGLNPDGKQFYRVDVKYTALEGKWEMRCNGGPAVLVEPFADVDPPRWVTLFGPIPNSDWLTRTSGLELSPKDNYENTSLQIHDVIVWETYENSQYSPGKVLPDRVAGNYTTYSYPNMVLDEVLTDSHKSLDSHTLTDLAMKINALFEYTTDRPPLGEKTQRIQGHNHNPTSYGGRSVAMACICSTRTFDTSRPRWQLDTGPVNTWKYGDQDASARRTTALSSPGGTITTLPMFRARVTPGFTSSGSPPTSAPFLCGAVYVRHDSHPSATLEVRIYSLSSAAYSTTTSGTGFIFFIEKIPCSGGANNRYVIEVRCTDTANVTAQIMGYAFFEVGSYNGGSVTYKSSNGSTPLAVANEFRRL